jgi:hypothetical protein
MTRKVERHDLPEVSEGAELRLPEIRGPTGTVNQDEGRARPRFEPRRGAPGDGPRAPGRSRHTTAPRAVIGQSASTRPPLTATYQSYRLIVGSQ